MKKLITLISVILLLSSCAALKDRQTRNFEIWFPGRVAQFNQLNGIFSSSGCTTFPKPILKFRSKRY